jgi:hypothetical protein
MSIELGYSEKKKPHITCISKKEKTTSEIKAVKDMLRNLLGCNANGGHKLKPHLVYHSENPSILKTQARLTFHIITNQKSWL